MSYGGFEYGQDTGGGGFGGYGGGGDSMGGGGFGDQGGGGFADVNGASQGGGGGSQGQGDRDLSRDSVVPVTIKQLLDNPPKDGACIIDGTEVKQVVLVAAIVEVELASTNCKYMLEDSTGRMEVTKWLNQDEGDADVAEREKLVKGAYVRVTGVIREFNGAVGVLAFNIQVITDFNVVTQHYLECIYVHCVHTKGELKPAGGAVGGGQQFSSMAGGSMQNQGFGGGVHKGASLGMGGDAGMGMGGGGDDNQTVLRAFTDLGADNEQGVSLDTIAQSLGAKFPMAKLRSIVDNLAAEGHLYSTIDDMHFKGTS